MIKNMKNDKLLQIKRVFFRFESQMKVKSTDNVDNTTYRRLIIYIVCRQVTSADSSSSRALL